MIRPATSTLARLTGLTLAVVLAFAGLLVGTTTASADESDPMLGAPAVGGCYNLSLKEAYQPSTSKATVDCAKKHTLLVGAVDEIPASVDWKDDEALWKHAQRICNPFWNKQMTTSYVTRYYTLLQPIWLMPTKAQQADGARWISCMAGVSTGTAFVPTTTATLPKASKKPADAIARCADKKYRTVPCSKQHSWRASFVFTAKAKGNDKAVHAAIERAAVRRCPSKVASKRWLYSYRSAATKTSYVVACLAETTK